MRRNPLIAVQTQRETIRDRERIALGKLLTEDTELSNKIEQIYEDQAGQLAEVAGLSRQGRVDVRAAASRRYYAGQLRGELIQLAAARQELAREIEVQRRQLAEADAAVKAVENLIAKRVEQEQIEADRRTQLQIEDQWSASHAAQMTDPTQ